MADTFLDMAADSLVTVLSRTHSMLFTDKDDIHLHYASIPPGNKPWMLLLLLLLSSLLLYDKDSVANTLDLIVMGSALVAYIIYRGQSPNLVAAFALKVKAANICPYLNFLLGKRGPSLYMAPRRHLTNSYTIMTIEEKLLPAYVLTSLEGGGEYSDFFFGGGWNVRLQISTTTLYLIYLFCIEQLMVMGSTMTLFLCGNK